MVLTVLDSCLSSLVNTKMRRRHRMWCAVGIGVGLLRHDGKVEGVAVKDDAVLERCVRGRARYAQAHIPKR